MLLAKIKGNKDYFGKLVTFLEEGVNLSPTYPLDPLLIPLKNLNNLRENFDPSPQRNPMIPIFICILIFELSTSFC